LGCHLTGSTAIRFVFLLGFLFVWAGELLTAGCSREAPVAGPSEAEVVARVDGEEVTRAELEELAEWLASRRHSRGEPDLDAALESWIESRLLHDEVAARGLADDGDYRTGLAAVRARVWRSEQELARNAVVSALAQGLVFSNEDLREFYDATSQRFLTTRLHLRQITLPDRETILAIRKRLADGDSFEQLASQANLDPALRQRAGDLGWLEQRKLPTSVIGPAHRLVEDGEVTEPFRDREGRWNLVQLVAKERSARRSFESVRDQLDRELRVIRSREALVELLKQRRAGLNVERIGR
jgi:hypothetical protein